jgi:glutamate dehydrogenase
MPNSTGAPIEHSIFQVMKEASLLYCLPDNPFFRDSVNSGHAVQEATYACMFNIVEIGNEFMLH